MAAPLPEHVREAVLAALDEHAVTPPSRGHLALREAIARSLPAPADPEREILVTNGAMHALSLTFRALLEPGDEVIVPTPCYFFGGLIERAGGVFVPVPSWDPEAIERAVTPRSRALVLTNPNNPDGHLPSRAEIDELLALASRHGLTVITDEAYERCIHEGELACAWGAPNVILIRSLGKSLAMPAWRIGFVAAEPAVIDACLRELEWDVIRVSHVAQRAATAALEGPQDWLDEVAAGLSPGSRRSSRGDRRAPDPERRAPGRGTVPLARARRALVGRRHRRGLPGRRRRRLRHARLRASSVRRLCEAPWLTATGSASTSAGRSPTSSCSAPMARCGRRRCCRRPTTTRAASSQGILELLEETGAAPASVTKVVHATTVASNAVLEGKGSRCCLLTTAGFRDVLEMRRLRIPVMYELQYEKPPPLVPRRLRYEIPERTGPRGEEWVELDEQAVREAAERARAAGVASVAISFLHAYANPAHERRAAEIVREVVGDGRLHHLLLRDPRRDPRVRAHEHGGRERVRRPRRRALHPLARVEPGRGRDLGAAADHAVERRPDERRGRDPEAGAPRRVRAGRRRRRLRLPRARDRHPERDLARHGRDDGEGRDPRGRPAGQDVGVRGRRRDQPEQPADQGRRLRDPAPVHRPVRDRRGRRQPRLGGRVRDAARRPRERGRRSRARPATASAATRRR